MNYKVIPFAAAAMLMSGCWFSEDSVTNASAEAKEKAQVTVKVVDAKSGLPVDSAKVFSVLKGDTVYTNAKGLATWKGNVLGDYDYIVMKDGYASTLTKVTIEETGKGNTARVPDRIVDVSLHQEGVTVNGTVLMKDAYSDNLSAAQKIPVVIRYVNGDVYPSEVETVTNSSGVFSFENLAEFAEYEIVVPQAVVDKQTYEAVTNLGTVSGLRAGEVRNLSQITMEVVGLRPELIHSNLNSLDSIDEGADLKLTFSTKLIADSVSTSWRVFKGSYVVDGECYGGTEALAFATLDKDGKTVIVQSVSGKWNRATYCVEGVVYTSEGYSASLVRTFVPGSLTERPSNVKLYDIDDTDYPTLLLSWKAPAEDITGYKIFYKTNKMADFIEFTTIEDPKALEYSVNANDYRFEDVGKVSFAVLPYAMIGGKEIISDVESETFKARTYTFD